MVGWSKIFTEIDNDILYMQYMIRYDVMNFSGQNPQFLFDTVVDLSWEDTFNELQ